MKRFEKPRHQLNALILGLTALVFIIDSQTPLGFAIWIFYLAPVILTVFGTQPALPIIASVVCSILVCLGYVLSPPGVLETYIVASNRVFGLTILWIVAPMVRQVILARLSLKREEWLRSGQTGLSEQLAGEMNYTEIARKTLTFCANYLGAQIGTFFIEDETDHVLRRKAVYAIPEKSNSLPETVRYGETLIGQAAAEKKILVLKELAKPHFTVQSSIGESHPQGVLVVPFVNEGRVKGVMELGFLKAFNTIEPEFLQRISDSVAVALQAAQYQHQLEELLRETQTQSEELKMQGEEMQVNNEELAEQSRQLQEAQVRLESSQAELEQTNAQLESQASILEQQKDALNKANQEIQKRAEELETSSRYKSEFLANMSHELRTPLNSSLILSKLLMDNSEGNLTPEQIKFATTIYNSGNDLLALINDILDLAKVEAGKMEILPSLFTAQSIVEKMRETFQPTAATKGLDLRFKIASDVPETLKTDQKRLEQIIKNLLSNAVKFTQKGSVALSISKYSPVAGDKYDSGTDWVRFEVKDTGIGIPAHQQEVIFEAFRQADGTTNRKYGGTGLGLSISRDLASLMGGEIKVSSEVGKGSTFTLITPAQFAPQLARTPNTRAKSAETALTVPTLRSDIPQIFEDKSELRSSTPALFTKPASERFVLIVEDEPAFSDILVKYAEDMQFGSVVCKTAAEAIRAAEKLQPQAILLDVQLPDNRGLGLLDQLKSNPKTRHIPVHVVSSHDFSKAALEMGAVGYVLKPAKTDQLREAFLKLEAKMKQSIKRVLVVEDNEAQAESLRELLKLESIQVVTAYNGREALQKLTEDIFDCLILDLSLPDMTGFEFLERMAIEDTLSFPPVIVYTGQVLSREEEDRLRRTSQSIIIKGAVSPERLLSEVTLFLHHVEDKLPAEKQRMLREYRDKSKNFSGRRILIVDDDIRNIFALSAVLESKGARIEVARNGKEALQKLDETPEIELVLMDIMMPEMNGYEAMREIRKQGRFTRLPIIAVTAKAMRDDYEKCIQSGANDYLPKPIETEKLLSLIRVWLPQEMPGLQT